MSEMGLTQVQANCFDAIKRLTASNGVTPSLEELAGALGMKSRGAVHRTLDMLEERGYIRRLPNKARAIEIVDHQLQNRVSINPEILRLVVEYARDQRIQKLDTAVNELLRLQLGAA